MADLFEPNLPLLPQALAVIALAAVKWVAIDVMEARLAPGWTPGNVLPVLNQFMGTGVLIAASMIGIYRIRRARLLELIHRPSEYAAIRVVLFSAAILLLTFGLSIEIDRAFQQLVHLLQAGRVRQSRGWEREQVCLLSIFWSMLAILSVFAGFWLRAGWGCDISGLGCLRSRW